MRPGSLLPEVTLAALRRKNDAGGVRISKVNERSEKTVIFTGIGTQVARETVNGLRAFQNGESGAVWQWRFMFWEHWGRHAVGAMAALRAWLEAEGTGW